MAIAGNRPARDGENQDLHPKLPLTAEKDMRTKKLNDSIDVKNSLHFFHCIRYTNYQTILTQAVPKNNSCFLAKCVKTDILAPGIG